ncbi:hypothetical protein WN51_05294 [Melipona quadrifasciata]|uniref:Uncharacterized protein n=1 Tax=Melipona quadrifasciata TaxID=166423 RepID=A0A0N0U7P4_9HYME|nr:hypothetical protein WN51_05294 [Melipona quadrifasciata]
MHSYTQSACDCYCKTRVPIARRREEVQRERSRVRGSRNSVLKMETGRSAAKRVPLIAAKAVNDEQVLQRLFGRGGGYILFCFHFDSKRSAVTLPVSPVLSPETTATLENVEKLIRDAEIQMKEISMIASCARFQSCIDVRPDVPSSFDDENDQLLYVRERVACKFQEANGWIDTDSGNSHRFANEERDAIEPTSKRLVDLSAPKFQTSEDRYEKFSRQRRLDIQKLGLASSHSVDKPESDERVKKMDDGVRSPRKETERHARMDAFSVKIGPSVNIKGDLVAQNLANIHISPDPSFTRENQNIGTYVVRRDPCKKNGSSGRREKIAKIVEKDKDAVKSRKRNTEPDSGSDSGRSAVLTNIEKLDKKDVEDVHETGRPFQKNFENEKNLEAISRDESANLEEPKTRGISNDGVASETPEEREVKITFKGEQKQVRFEEQCSEKRVKETVNPSETECRKNRPEIEEEATRILEEKNLRIPSTSIELEGRRIADKTEQYKYPWKQFEADDEHVPLSSREIAEKHKANRKRHREIREDRYKEIDERFANIVRTCREERSKSCEEGGNALLLSVISAESSEESLSDSLDFSFYEPSMNELDDVLVSYDRIIGNIVQSTRTIDKFLSRPELREYRVDDDWRGEIAEKCSNLASNRENIEETETDSQPRSRGCESSIEGRLLVASESLNKERNLNEMKRVKGATSLSLANLEDDISKRRGEPAIKRRDMKMKDRLDRSAWERRASSENSETTEIDERKQTFPRKARLFRIVNDSSSLTASSICPLTSSTCTRSANDTRLSEETSRLSNNDEFVEKGAILKVNPSETKGDSQNVPSDGSKGIILEKGKLENFVARLATRDDAKFTEEDRAKNEIVVPVVIKSLLERLLENDQAYPENFRSLISECYSSASNNVASSVRTADVTAEGKSDDESEKRNSQLELPSNSAATETEGRRNGEGEATSDKSEDKSVLKRSEIASRGGRSRDEEADKISCSIELEESSKTGDKVDGTRTNFESYNENSADSRTNETSDENLISARTESNVADESTTCEPSRIVETLKDDLLHEVGKEETNLMENGGKSEENLMRGDSEASNENLVDASEKVEDFVESRSIENAGNDDGFVKKIAQDSSNSLRDCASLRSSLRNLSRSSSNNNNTKPSREASEFKRTETSNATDAKIENMNDPRYDSVLMKEKILSDVYDEMNKKLFSSTCLDTNAYYSSFLNQQRFSNGISAKSTIRSNKIEISSDTSHSEGEYMPSSGSWSLGEVRMLRKNRSDSENTDNFDSSVAIFVTKEMLTSWSESSKVTESVLNQNV